MWQGIRNAKIESFNQKIQALNFPSFGFKKLSDIPELDATLIPLDGILGGFEQEITNSDVEILLHKLALGQWTATQVIEAFSKRAILAHEVTNCLSEIFFERAKKRALELDEIMKTTKKPVGKLHGLPISLKDQIEIEGVDATVGFISWANKPSEKDALIVELLEKQGAIVYCKTNVPQGLMSCRTENLITGSTINPYNLHLSPGGSSGGEGALIAMRGSVLGIGSDVGGSIRIPAGFCGTYALRPCYHRLPYWGTKNTLEGQEINPSVLGPLSSSLFGVKALFQAILETKPWQHDPLVINKPWSESAYELVEHGKGKDMCFGILRDYGDCRALPPYQRALDMVTKALEKAGHKVVEWSVPQGWSDEGKDIIDEIFQADGKKDIINICAATGEYCFYHPENSLMPPHLLTHDYWQLTKRRNAYVKQQMDWLMESVHLTGTGRSFDAVIMPVSGNCAERETVPQEVWWTSMCNLMDLPATVFPVTRVDPNLDSPSTLIHYQSSMEENIHEAFDPKIYSNSPIGLQCVGQRGEEECVIRITELIEIALRDIDS